MPCSVQTKSRDVPQRAQRLEHQKVPAQNQEALLLSHRSSQGPDFIDTGHCHCAVVGLPDLTGTAWRCLGDAQKNIYQGHSGKWFRFEEDSLSPPDRDTPLVVPPGSNDLVEVRSLDKDPFTPFDRACTGKKKADITQTLDRARREQEDGKTPVSAAMCWRRGAAPMMLQNQSSWMNDGCSRGFYCEFSCQ